MLQQRIVGRIGHPDCYIGLPEGAERRLARLLFLEPDQRDDPEFTGMRHPPLGWGREYNNLGVLRSCQPSGGGVASARDLAGVLNLLACRGRYKDHQFWDPRSQAEASRPRSPAGNEQPASPGLPGAAWGLGFLVPPTPEVFGTRAPGPSTIGHAGASGSVAWADPDLGLSVAFTIDGLLGRRHFHRYRVLGDLVQQAVVRRSAA